MRLAENQHIPFEEDTAAVVDYAVRGVRAARRLPGGRRATDTEAEGFIVERATTR